MSLISSISAVTDWAVEPGEFLVYTVKIQDNDVVTNEGTFNLSINAISSEAETLQFSIVSDLSVDTTNLAGSLDMINQQINGDKFNLSVFNLILLYDLPAFGDFKDYIDTYVKGLTTSYADTYGDYKVYRYGIKQLSYGWEIKWWNMEQNINTYQKIQYNKDGILTAYENSTLSADGKESGVKLSLQTYSGASGGIPGYAPFSLAGIGIATVGLLVWRKKRN